MARAKRRHSQSGETEFEDELEETAHQAAERAGRHAHRMQRTAFDAFDMLNGPMARLMDRNWSMFQRTMQAMQAESLRFMNRRLEHTSHVLENRLEHDGISGVLAIQQEWMVEFARDYAEQSKRLAELMQALAESGVSSLPDVTPEVSGHAGSESEHGHRHAT